MPLHRKPTHRLKIIAATLGVAGTVSGVAVAAQMSDDTVSAAPEPRSSSAPASSDTAAAPGTDDRAGRATRSSTTGRAPLPATPTRTPAKPRTSKTPAKPLAGGVVSHVVPDRAASAVPTARAATPTPSQKPAAPPPSRTPDSSPTPPAAPPPSRTPDSSPTPPAAPTTAARSAMAVILDGTNAARRAAGRVPVGLDPCLADLAQRHAEQLASAGRLYHQDLGSVMRSCGVTTSGENVAMNTTGATAMVDQWLGSPGHRANLLDGRFSRIGIGVAQARDGSWYAVQVFGGR